MRIKQCMMCHGKHFFLVHLETPGGFGNGEVAISLGMFRRVPVRGLVCLECGFVAPCVDHGGLVAIRETARSEGIPIDGEPGKEALREL